MIRSILFLSMFFLSTLAWAEFDFSLIRGQFYYSADRKFLIAEDDQSLNVFDSRTKLRILKADRTPGNKHVTCPLPKSGLVEYRKIPRSNEKFFDLTVRRYESDFSGYQDVLSSSIGFDEATPVGICDLDSNRMITITNPKGSIWTVPQRKLEIFNGVSNVVENYLLPEAYWDSVSIYDVAISEEQDIVAYFRSDRGGNGEMIDVRQFSTGKLIYRTLDYSQQYGSAKKLKFADHGRRLIFDNRIIYSSLTGKKLYEAPKARPTFLSSLMIPIGEGHYHYVAYDDLSDQLQVYNFDENAGTEKLVASAILPTAYTVSLTATKDKIAFGTFGGIYELDLTNATIRNVPSTNLETPNFVMYDPEDQKSVLYLNRKKDEVRSIKP